MTNEEIASDDGACPLRLSPRQWLVVLALVAVFFVGASPGWKRRERFDHNDDYRVPYELSNDYWLYERHLQQSRDDASNPIFVVGDSVMWGEYVRADGTLSHFLNEQHQDDNELNEGDSAHYINAGINGQFPLALEGLVRYHADPIRNQKVLLHCNLLWMSSPEADLSGEKEQTFNHAALVPQFRPRLACYRASREQRLGYMVRRRFEVLGWVTHLQNAYFDQQSVPKWTLAESSEQPGTYPNAYRNPLSQITGVVSGEPSDDPQRGRSSERHRDWRAAGMQPQIFDWVAPVASQQWAAFQRLVQLLSSRGNDVLVVIGPFNETMLATSSRDGFQEWQTAVSDWLQTVNVPCAVPKPLAAELYGDASHPLTDGYREMAKSLQNEVSFQRWLTSSQPDE